jgi:hypothetical protein
MALTPEERRQINIKNASRSTGPKSPEGRRRASLNATKHGLRAEALALPHEDVEELNQITDDWLDYHQPRSPGQRAALDRCLYSHLQLKRCARFQAAAVAEQVRKAGLEWQWAQDDELERLKKLLKTEPDEAVRLLKRSALGCRWMLSEWHELSEALNEEGEWVDSRRDRAIRLLGQRPGITSAHEDESAYLVRYYTLFSRQSPCATMAAALTDPRHMPDTLHREIDGIRRPVVEACRESLRLMMAEEVKALTALEKELRREIEEPSRAEAEERAEMLNGPDGVLLARYVRMHDAMYNRAYKALTQGEKKASHDDAPCGSASEVFDPFGEVEVLDLSVGRAGAPNEANQEGAAGASEAPRAGIKPALVDVSRPRKRVSTPSAPLGGAETPPARGS